MYTLLTIAGIIALRLCGMSWFDAICHAFSAVGLGGFSTHDANIAYFNSPSIEFVLMVLMLVASLNFACHFVALRRLTLSRTRQHPEAQGHLRAAGGERARHRRAAAPGTASIPDFFTALRHAAFNVVSHGDHQRASSPRTTRAGRCSRPIWMLFLSCIVCSTGSIGGGIKMFRTLVLSRQASRELKLLVHPSAVAPVRVGGSADAGSASPPRSWPSSFCTS